MREILVLLDVGGLLFLLASAPHLRDILASVNPGKIKLLWRCLAGLVGFFVVGYVAMTFSNWVRTPDAFDLVMSALMFFGGAFVLAVTTLSHWTVHDCRRVASLEQQVHLDPLTTLYNRRYLERRLEGCQCDSLGRRLPLTFLLFDIDHFKVVNDARGHAQGDTVLRAVAQAIFEKCRVNDLAFRYGGDEFLVVSPYTSTETAERLATSICRAIAAGDYGVTVSVGLATVSNDGDDLATALRNADQALYRAKNNGRNRVEVFDPEMSGLAVGFA